MDLKRISAIPRRLLFDREYFWYLAALLFIGEVALNCIIINKVKYTEIDWIAYMQEVKGYLDGELDYRQLRGDTGPLVYPAGFVYIYAWLYDLTEQGTNIRLAQYIFMGIYLLTLLVVFAIYRKSAKIPPYTIGLLCISKRLHSIYVLRCFNDPVAMFFLYACILAMLHRRWVMSSTLFSVALSIKMNVFLFFPGFGILLWESLGAWTTLAHLGLVFGIQVGLAYPFLISYPDSYLGRAFEFGRIFDYQWTVNWRMVDQKVFVSSEFANALMLGQVLTLLAFVLFRWCRGKVLQVFLDGFSNKRRIIPADEIITTMFTSNFMGIVFARSLHYQFYSWYYHTLPYLITQIVPGTPLWKGVLRTIILIIIEICWLTFPSTEASSWTLVLTHGLILVGLFWS